MAQINWKEARKGKLKKIKVKEENTMWLLSETKGVMEGWWGHNKKWQQTEGKMSATEGATSETYDWPLAPNFAYTQILTHILSLSPSLSPTHTYQMNLQSSLADFSLLTWLTLPNPISPCHMVSIGGGERGLERQTQHVRETIENKGEIKTGERKQTNRGFTESHEAPLRSVG